MPELKYWKNKAESYYINHPTQSFAIIMINEVGDLMINSDWGILNNAWRQANPDFKTFLAGLDEGYWKQKMSYNLNNMRFPKKEVKRTVDNVWPIFVVFQDLLKRELAGEDLPFKSI